MLLGLANGGRHWLPLLPHNQAVVAHFLIHPLWRCLHALIVVRIYHCLVNLIQILECSWREGAHWAVGKGCYFVSQLPGSCFSSFRSYQADLQKCTSRRRKTIVRLFVSNFVLTRSRTITLSRAFQHHAWVRWTNSRFGAFSLCALFDCQADQQQLTSRSSLGIIWFKVQGILLCSTVGTVQRLATSSEAPSTHSIHAKRISEVPAQLWWSHFIEHGLAK